MSHDKEKFEVVRMARTPEDQQFFKDHIHSVYRSMRQCALDLDVPWGGLEKFVQGKARMLHKDLSRIGKVCGFTRAEITAHTEGRLIPRTTGVKYQEPAPNIPDMSKPLTVETINDGGVLNLAAAIVGSVAKEYKLAVRKAKRRGIDREEFERRARYFVELKNISELRRSCNREYNISSTAYRRTSYTKHLAAQTASEELWKRIKAEELKIRESVAPITNLINLEEYFYSDDFRQLADINPDAVVEKVWRDVWKDKNLKISHMCINA